MKKIFSLLGVALMVSACAGAPQDARCKCFDANGNPTGNCNFAAVDGAPVTFGFMATQGSVSAGHLSCSRH